MICPQCNHRTARGRGACPNCGMQYVASTSGLLKTSTVLISADDTDAVYASVEDVPARLRDLLVKSTSGLNSATILIADQAGKEQIAKAIRKLPLSAQQELTPGLALDRALFGFTLKEWSIGALAVFMSAAALAVCFGKL